MKRFVVLTIATFSLLTAACAHAAPNRRRPPRVSAEFAPKTFKTKSGYSLLYCIHTPKAMDAKKTYPLVLSLHGAGGSGDGNRKQVGQAMRIAKYSIAAKHDAIILAPQCPRGDNWCQYGRRDVPKDIRLGKTPTKPMGAVIELLKATIKDLPVDPSRVYVIGNSMGGAGTWCITMREPELFAAAVPMCGNGDHTAAKRLVDMPIWAFHGSKDPVVKVETSRLIVAAIKAAGGKKIKYTEPDTGHSVSKFAFENDVALKWLFAQKKAKSVDAKPAAKPAEAKPAKPAPNPNDRNTPMDEIRLMPNRLIGLWPDRPRPKDLRANMVRRGNVTRITKVTVPLIEVHFPQPSVKTVDAGPTPAIMVCPGGGYGILAWDLEGVEICKWANEQGYAAVLLRYTVPRNRDAALADAQRALGMIRHNAKDWNINPAQIGMIGFSAGGHLTARLSTNYQKRTYKAIDAADAASCRPDFSILIYPAYISPRGKTVKIDAGLPVDTKTPPAFIGQSLGDRSHINSARAYAAALKKAGVPYEVHLYKDGRHGYGLRSPKTDDASQWPTQCAAWLKTILKNKREGSKE